MSDDTQQPQISLDMIAETLPVDLELIPEDHHVMDTLKVDMRRPTHPPERLEDYTVHHDLELRQKLGEGGMGSVYLAFQESIGREVAVKMLRRDGPSSKAHRLLLEEAWITGRLDHPNIVPVHSVGRDDGENPLIVMKRVQGISWLDAIADPDSLPLYYQGEEELEVLLDIFEQVCRATHFAHTRQILHRDIKPENVMLGAFGEVYLVDWGIAVSMDEDPDHGLPIASHVNVPMGTPCFMAPEMAAGEGDKLGPWTDVFLLGATLHFALTKKPRHGGRDTTTTLFLATQSRPFVYDPDIPGALADICNKATSKEIEDRYQSAEELRRAIADFRRHRDSIELAERTQEKLTGFLDAARSGSERSEVEELQLSGTFGAVRFGFERALDAWPDNWVASRGLEAARRAMLEVELGRKNPLAAQALLETLERPDDELRKKVDALRREVAEEQARVEKMQRALAERDPRRGVAQRGLLAVLLAVVMVAFNASYALLFSNGVLESTPTTMAWLKVVDGTVMIGVLALGSLLAPMNRMGKHILAGMAVMLAAGVVIRGVSVPLGMETAEAAVFESILYATSAMIVGVFVDWRLLIVGPLALLGGVGSLLFPEMSWILRLSANMGTLMAVGAIWMFKGGGDVAESTASAAPDAHP